MKISKLFAREILDSRGVPTVESTIILDDGSKATGAVPSGTSTGSTEVLELRDGDKRRYFGKGVLKAVENINLKIAPKIIGKSFSTQAELDNYLIKLDGTKQKSSLGGNSILSVSMAFCRASAISQKLELYEYFAQQYWGPKYDKKLLTLPRPMILLIEGGKHGNWATDIQEFMVMPITDRFASFAEQLRMGAEMFKALHDLLEKKEYSTTVGFEGAFAPTQLSSNYEAFDLILKAGELAGYKAGKDFELAIDAAASEFYDNNIHKYVLPCESVSLTAEEWLDLQLTWFKKYPFYSVEDTFDEADWGSWKKLMDKAGSTLQVVGDDLTTTNVKRIKKAQDLKVINAVLIKLNQIGTVTETLNAIKMCEMAGYNAVISHRGSETNDSMIADLVVGTYAQQSKFGGPDRGERVAKYNRLTEIELELTKK